MRRQERRIYMKTDEATGRKRDMETDEETVRTKVHAYRLGDRKEEGHEDR